MRAKWTLSALICCFLLSTPCHSENLEHQVKKAIELSTLDQLGTKPFHLKAELSPSHERDKDSGRTGTVEIWWEAPDHWRRELSSPGFHQIQIVDGGRLVQKNDGDYLPEWLRETADALTDPAPRNSDLMKEVRGADVKHLMGNTYLSWTIMSTNGEVQSGMGAGISVTDSTGLLFTANGFGWGGWFRDYTNFHGRMVARTVSTGSPEVTAKLTVLEDLNRTTDGLLDPGSISPDPLPLQTVLVDETSLRKNLLPVKTVAWPELKDGPLEGAATAKICVDRSGKVREVGGIVSSNPGVNETAREEIAAMTFTPFVEDGKTVQVFSRITLSFKTSRPQGVETFESARTFFERGRREGFPAAGAGKPYVLHADFETKGSSGAMETGHYEDTWISDSQWRREATFEASHYVRSRDGNKSYQLAEGPEAGFLKFLFQAMEPIPAIDTFVESDWRIKSDSVDGIKTVRVLSGYESPDGKLDSVHTRGYWFDEQGNLVKAYFSGLETRRSDFQEYNGVRVARHLDILKDGSIGVRIRVTDLSAAGDVPRKTFELKGHEWTRAFTAEVR